jgi:carbamoyl-phosphate synthase large subunit
MDNQQLVYNLRVPNPERVLVIKQAFEDGFSQDQIFEYTKIDPWFVAQFWELHQAETWLKTLKLDDISAFDMLQTKKRGFSDSQIARFTGWQLTHS